MNYLNGIEIDIQNKTTLFEIATKIAEKNAFYEFYKLLKAKDQQELLLSLYSNQNWLASNGFELIGNFVFPKTKTQRVTRVEFKKFDFGKNNVEFYTNNIEFSQLKLEKGCIFPKEIHVLFLDRCNLDGFVLPNCKFVSIVSCKNISELNFEKLVSYNKLIKINFERCTLDFELVEKLMLKFGKKISFNGCCYNAMRKKTTPLTQKTEP